MKLKDAVIAAGRFAGDSHPFSDIRIEPGKISAWNSIAGVEIACEAAKLKCAVPAVQIVRAVKSLSDPQITKGRGQTVQVKQDGSRFTVKTRLAKLKPPVEVSGLKWFPLPAAAVEAVKAAAAVVEPTGVSQAALTGLYVSPRWIGGASNAGGWFVWPQGAFNQLGRSAAVDPKLWSGVEGSCRLALTDKALVIEDQAEQTRWALTHNGKYPAASVESLVTTARDHTGRVVVSLDIKALKKLCKIATAATVAPAESLKMTVTGNLIQIERPQDDAAGFEGSVAVSPLQTGERSIGILPGQMLKFLEMCVEPDAKYYMAVGEQRQPIVIWGGKEAVVEIAVNAVYLP